MAQLYNAITKKPETLAYADLQNAILSGSHTYETGAQIPVVSPDGESGTVPSENLAEAIRSGFRVQAPGEQAIGRVLEAGKGFKGDVTQAAQSFANQAFMGLPDLMLNYTLTPWEIAAREAFRKEHKLASDIGDVGGFLASLPIGGPLFKLSSKTGEGVANYLSERLATQAGETVGKRAASEFGKKAAAAVAGGIAEGATLVAPHALTETAFGDYDAAAQTLLAGGGLGGALGLSVPAAKGIVKMGKGVYDEAAALAGMREKGIDELARRMAAAGTGVNKDAIEYYMANPERVNAAASTEQLADLLARDIGLEKDALNVAKLNLKQGESELAQAYANARRDLAQAQAPLSVADDVMASLEGQKAILGQMSEQADEILGNIGGAPNALAIPGSPTPGIHKDELLKFILKIRHSMGELVGETDIAAANKLKKLGENIQENLPEIVSYPKLRDVMRQVRRDINWNQLAGEFNERANQVKKTFTESISEFIKGQSPEYEALMGAMRERSNVLEEMSKNFGSREKAVNSINNIIKGGAVKDDLLSRYSRITGEDLAGRLETFKQARALLEESARGDISAKLVPNLYRRVEGFKQAVAGAEERYKPLQSLGRSKLQNVIRNMGGTVPDIFNRRGLEYLEQLTGTPYLQMIKDRNVYDAFFKASTQGSRKAVTYGSIGGALGTAIGGAPGGVFGGAVGAGVGAFMDIYGGQVLKKILDMKPAGGLLFVEKAFKKTGERLNDIPNILRRMADGKGVKTSTYALHAINYLLGSYDPDEKPAKRPRDIAAKIERLGKELSALLASPALLEENLAPAMYGLSQGGAPKIAQAFAVETRRAVQYVYDALPKPLRPRTLFDSSPPWSPSDQEIIDLAEKLQVINDPMSVLQNLENGTLTKEHMAALKAVYPSLFLEIQKRIIEVATGPDAPNLSYLDRVKLSILTDLPLDESLTPEGVFKLQMTFINQAKAEMPFAPTRRKIDMANAELTTTQALMERRS